MSDILFKPKELEEKRKKWVQGLECFYQNFKVEKILPFPNGLLMVGIPKVVSKLGT